MSQPATCSCAYLSLSLARLHAISSTCLNVAAPTRVTRIHKHKHTLTLAQTRLNPKLSQTLRLLYMAMASQGVATNSRLAQMQMRFQQKQQQEREQRRLEMSTNMHGSQDMLDKSATPATAMMDELVVAPTIGNGKVRQMFDERRRGAGIDRSHPLKPITTPTTATTTTAPSSTIRSRTQKVAQRTPKAMSTTATTMTTMRTTNGNAQRQTKNATPSYVKDFSSLSLQERTAAHKYSDSNNNNNISSSSSSSTPGRLAKSTRLNPVVTRKSPTVPTTQLDSRLQSTQSKNSANNRNRLAGGVSSAGVATSPMIKNTTKYTEPKKPVRPMAAVNDEAPPQGMSKCRFCGRSFNNDRLAKHENVCQKTMHTRRKIFDASKQRVKGTEAEKIMKKRGTVSRLGSTYSSAAQVYGLTTGVKKNNWRKKHEDFIKTIRAAKKVQAHLASGGKLSDLPPPPPSENPDYIQCPHCLRRFNEAAAERHIPRCATMQHNKPKNKPSVRGAK